MKKTALIFIVFISLMIGAFPSLSMECARNALSLCINTLIPSLLPFLICSNLIISLGGDTIASRMASNIMMPLFKVRGQGFIPLILGFLSGYPCGAVTLCNLYKNGALTRNEAHRLLSFANNSGPLFVIGVAGVGIFGQSRPGLILYAAHILTAITIGILSSFFADGRKDILPPASIKRRSASLAVSDSVFSMLNLCGYVIFFSVLLGIFQKLNIISTFCKFLCIFGMPEDVSDIISTGIFEIATAISSSGCKNLPAISAVINLGGISILFQTMSVTKSANLSIMPYIIGKLFAGGISALYTKILLCFFPFEAAVFSASINEKISVYTPYLFTFIMALICFVLFYIRLTPQDDKSVCPEKQSFVRTRS